jgi:cytochrome P450
MATWWRRNQGVPAMSIVLPSQSFTPPKRNSLKHIPGDEGWPIIGNTFRALADPKGDVERRAKKYGLVHRTRLFGETCIWLLGPEANELVLFDQAKQFSAEHGWSRFFGLVFPRGLMTRDFDEHRIHRKALSVAFKAGPMKSYLAELDKGIAAQISRWKLQPGEMLIYPATKRLTLDLAAKSFLGADIGPEADEINEAFIDMLKATAAPIRRPLPGTQMARGLKGRKRIEAYFSEQIPIRRKRGGGDDLFSQLCQATHDGGAPLTEQDVIDHMGTLMIAAHDTVTSSLTSLVYELAVHSEWQTRLRQEVMELGLASDAPMRFEDLSKMPLTEMAFNETLRKRSPAAIVPRRPVRDFTFKGFAIPAGTLVILNPGFTHHIPEIWPEPDRFDPTRFTEHAQHDRHRFAFVPFGGGAHMCLGLHFAYMQAKCFARHLLQNVSVALPAGYRPEWQQLPNPRPRDGLRLVMKPV